MLPPLPAGFDRFPSRFRDLPVGAAAEGSHYVSNATTALGINSGEGRGAGPVLAPLLLLITPPPSPLSFPFEPPPLPSSPQPPKPELSRLILITRLAAHVAPLPDNLSGHLLVLLPLLIAHDRQRHCDVHLFHLPAQYTGVSDDGTGVTVGGVGKVARVRK